MAEVVIDASLNTSAMESAINILVNDVDRKMKELAGKFDESVTQMEKSLKRMKDSARESTTAKNTQEKQSVSELGESYDKLASAMQAASTQASKRWDVSSIQAYRMQLNELDSEILRLMRVSWNQGYDEWKKVGSQIEATRNKIQQLVQEQEKLKSTPVANRFEEQQRLQQYQQLGVQIDALKAKEQELIASHSRLVSEFAKETPAGKQLKEVEQKYDAVKQKIRDMGVAMMQNASAEEASIKREQQIAEILKSKATAQDAYMRATKMDDKTYDNAVAKLERLKLVQEALNRNPILPESSILRLGRVIDETTQKIHKLESSQQQVAQTTSQTQNAINQQAQGIRQTGLSAEESARQVIDAESRKQAAVRQTGLDAQMAAQQILAIMHQQAMTDSDSPVMGIKQLTEAIKQMRAAYYSMGSEQQSPIGQALKNDIENAIKARQAVQEYNLSLMNLNSRDALKNASFYELKEQIQSLTEQYRWMTKRERESAQGRELIEKFQQLSKSANDVQKALNRPISLDKALGLSSSTLDDINYKMQMLRNYLGSINVDNNPKAANEIQQVNKALDELKTKQQQILGQNKQVQDSNTWLARSFQYMKNRLAFYFTIGASTQFIKNLIEIRSQYEMTERALGILVDSAERGSQIFNELSEMALKSPFTLIELSNAAKQLTAYDVAAKDVVDTTRRLADMAAAVGVNIDRLTYALGQVKAYGYLNARDARMFANAGIPLVKQLADYYTELEGRMVSVGDVYDRIKKKAIGYEDTMAVITKMTDEGGKFFDFQAKMADTLKVQLANLTLAWNNMLNEMGKSNSTLLTAPIKGLKSLFSAWKQIEQVFKDVAWTFAGIGLARLLATFTMRLIGVRMESYATAIAGKTLGTALAGVGKAFVALMSNPWTWIIAVGVALADLALNASRVTEAAEELRTAIEKSAEESINSLKKFREVNDDAIKDFSAGLLKPNELSKLWDSIKEELENSADSSSQIIPQLMSIGDISERVKTALEWSKRIDEANESLKNMGHNLIKINTDLVWGAFGEGVVSDIKDWASAIYAYKDILQGGGTPKEGASYWNEEKEALKEIEKVAQQVAHTVENLLGEEGMKDSIKVGEAVARIKQQIKLENPEIQGEIARLFDIDLDQILGKRWGEVYDNTTRLWEDLMSEVKKDSSSAFSDLSQEWLDGTEDMTNEQKKAFTDAANHLRATLPPTFREVLDEMMADLNKKEFRIRVGISFDTKLLDEVQKDFNKHFTGTESGKAKKPEGFNLWTQDEQRKWERDTEKSLQKFARFNRKQGESDLAWEKRLTEEKKAQNDNLKIQERRRKSVSEAVRNDAEQQIADAKELIGILDNIANYEKLDLNPDKNKKSKKTTNKSRVKEEDLVAKALKEELSVINEMQSAYDKLRKAGVGTTDALQLASSGYDKTLKSINATLSKYGIAQFKAEDFVGSNDPHKLLNALKKQLNTLVKSGKVKTSSLKDLEMEIKKITIDAREYDMKKITDGLNNELGKIKEEYELAVELDANPELGNIFADMMGISKEEIETLPSDFSQVMRKLQSAIDQNIGKNVFNLSENLNKDDFDKWIKQRGNELKDGFAEALDEIRKYANKVRLDETKNQINEWNKLIEKYGEIQAKLLKIHKDAAQEQVDLVKSFGTEEQVNQVIDLANKIKISKDPKEIARLSQELDGVVSYISAQSPQTLSISVAITQKRDSSISKAFWDDFKNSDLYSMTFEDMKNVSTRAIKSIIAQLDILKDKVKEDPASMKALMKSYEDAREELEGRNPFGTIISSLKEWADASKQVKIAHEELKRADKEVESAEANLKSIDPKNISEYTTGLSKLITARKKQSKAANNATTAENKAKKAQGKFSDACKSSADALSNAGSLIQQFAEILGVVEDSDAGTAIKAITQGLGAMAAALAFAAAMAMVLNSTMPYLAAIAAVIAVVTAAFSFLSNQSNNQINKEIKESELAVKRLENAYKKLEQQVKKAYGTQEYQIKRMLIANKQMQLEELKHQLQLEKQRKGKHRDEETIEDLKGQIIDMENEIEDAYEEIFTDLLGISSRSDFAEKLVEDMIEAFKEGEDYMKVFEESFDDMIDNMIMKTIVSRLIGDWVNNLFEQINQKKSVQADEKQKELDDLFKKQAKVNSSIEAYEQALLDNPVLADSLKNILDRLYRERDLLAKQIEDAQNAYNEAATPTPADIDEIREYVASGKEGIKDQFEAWMDAFGIQFGQNAGETNLSALQQGIQGITEETAGALEAYMNGVSQQVYYQSDLLTQIRDILVNFGGDVTIATNAQILLQLQQSFQVQMTIQNVLTGVLNASGLAFRVELTN